MNNDEISRNSDGTFTKAGAVSAGRKGGKAVSDRKTFMNKMRNRKKCTSACPMFERCPVMPVSWNLKGRPCKFKEAAPEVKALVYSVFIDGQDGILDAVRAALYQHAELTKDQVQKYEDNKKRRPPRAAVEANARLLMDYYKLVYGEKKEIQFPEGVTITNDPELLRKVGDFLARTVSGTPNQEEEINGRSTGKCEESDRPDEADPGRS
jgi:hypothetical protein